MVIDGAHSAPYHLGLFSDAGAVIPVYLAAEGLKNIRRINVDFIKRVCLRTNL